MDQITSSPLTYIIVGIALLVIIVPMFLRIAGRLLRKVGPNQALIVYGTGGTTITVGGGRFVVPLYQKAEVFSLELMSFSITQSLITIQGIAVKVEATVQIKVRNDEQSIRTAVQQILGKKEEERKNIIGQVMGGHLRSIVGRLTIENLVQDPGRVISTMREIVTNDMDNMGLEIVSFTIKDVRDDNNFITNMGRPRIAAMQIQADAAQIQAQRDTQIKQAEAAREAAIFKAQANQERVKAETEAQAKQDEYQHNLALKQAAFTAEQNRQKAIAEKAYDLQANIQQQQVIVEAVKVTEIEKQAQIKVQEAEIQRRELELQATVLKPMEAKRQQIIIESEAQARAEKARGVAEAEVSRAHGLSKAEVVRAQGQAEADAMRTRGQAEVEIVRARGEAEAESMKLKAAAYQEYNQAAVLDKLLTNMPAMVRAMAEPLSKVDKVTIVSTGTADGGSNGNSLGASRLTGELVNMAVQVPAIFEAVSGVKVSDLMSHVPAIANKGNGSVNGSGEGLK